MFERETRLYSFMLNYERMLIQDVDDARLAEQPVAGMNHAAWTLGHLALATDFALTLLDQPAQCPPDWLTTFGPGSEPVAERARYPSKNTLWSALESGHQAVVQALPALSPDKLDQPHPFELAFLKRALPSVGDVLAHLLTTHEAGHVGQLSAWRRALGLPGVLTI